MNIYFRKYRRQVGCIVFGNGLNKDYAIANARKRGLSIIISDNCALLFV